MFYHKYNVDSTCKAITGVEISALLLEKCNSIDLYNASIYQPLSHKTEIAKLPEGVKAIKKRFTHSDELQPINYCWIVSRYQNRGKVAIKDSTANACNARNCVGKDTRRDRAGVLLCHGKECFHRRSCKESWKKIAVNMNRPVNGERRKGLELNIYQNNMTGNPLKIQVTNLKQYSLIINYYWINY